MRTEIPVKKRHWKGRYMTQIVKTWIDLSPGNDCRRFSLCLLAFCLLVLFLIGSSISHAEKVLFSLPCGRGQKKIHCEQGKDEPISVLGFTWDSRERFYIAEAIKERIAVFDKGGTFLMELKSEDFVDIQKLFCDQDNNLYVVISSLRYPCTYLKKYSPNGSLLYSTDRFPRRLLITEADNFFLGPGGKILVVMKNGKAAEFRFDGWWLRKIPSIFIDNKGYFYNLSGNDLTIFEPNGSIHKKVVLDNRKSGTQKKFYSIFQINEKIFLEVYVRKDKTTCFLLLNHSGTNFKEVPDTYIYEESRKTQRYDLRFHEQEGRVLVISKE